MKAIEVIEAQKIDPSKNAFAYLTSVIDNELRKVYGKELKHFTCRSLNHPNQSRDK